MTRHEFRERQAVLDQSFRRLSRIAFGLFFIFGLVPIIVGVVLIACGHESLAKPVIFLGLLGLPIGGVLNYFMTKRLTAAHVVRCPFCGKPFRGMSAELAMTTGRCGKCGERVVEDVT